MDKTTSIFSHREPEPEQSVLYLVGTPIGNLNDISIRAINILKKVSLIACEDTRTTKKLLNHLKISNKLISFHKYNASTKVSYLISRLEKKDSIALVSDAGMPLISDPGDILVKIAKENQFDVICIPGPCAAITALVSSGISASKFLFFGFIPKRERERIIILKKIAENEFTSIIYESPKRILRLLGDLKVYCGGDRKIILTKELTKRFEKHYGNNINEVINEFKVIDPRGEFTLIIEPKNILENNEAIKCEHLKSDLNNLIKAGLSHSSASKYLAQKHNKSKKEIYNLTLKNYVE